MKLLREISVKDGLPKTDGIYTVHIDEDPHTSAIYFFTDNDVWGGGFGVTSWYEEVDLSDIKDKAYNEGFSTAKKVLEEILDRFQKKIVEINNKANESLDRLNEREGKNYQHINGMYACNEGYYRNVARFAWAERAKQIAMLEMQSFLNELRKELA